MKRILVAIKRVVDYNVRIRVKPDGSGVVTEGVKLSINPFDEIAVEEALRIRERGHADEVVVVSIGPAGCEQQLRTALALGADRALHILTDEAREPYGVAQLLRAIVEREGPILVVLGKQAVDDDNGQTGQMLAALWQRPQATYASKIEFHDDSARVTREVDSGLEVLDVDLPAVVTTDLRLNEPRYVKLPDILKAKRKPVEQSSPADLGVRLERQFEVVRIDPPPLRQKGVIIDNAAALVAALDAKGLL